MVDYHRITTLFAAVFTLIQGVVWLVVSVFSIEIYNCDVNFPNYSGSITDSKIDYLMYIAYFTGTCIGKPRNQLPGSAFRTYVFMIIYAAVSALWIPVSILLMAGVFQRVKGAKGVSAYSPWITITSVIQLIDLVASIIYGIDISNTKTIDGYIKLVQPFEIPADVYFDGVTVIPSILMTIFFSRAIIIWVINVILLGVVIQALITMKKNPRVEPTKRVRSIQNGNIGDTTPYINSNEDRRMSPQQNRYVREKKPYDDYPRNLEGADVAPMRYGNSGDKTPYINSNGDKIVSPQENRYVGEKKPYDEFPRNFDITDEETERVYIPGKNYYRRSNYNQGYAPEEAVPHMSNNYPQQTPQTPQTPVGQQRALGWSYINPQEIQRVANLRHSNDPWIPEPDYVKGGQAPRKQIIPRVQADPLSGPGNTGGY